MTKDTAIEAMKNGKKVTHNNFARDEWATMINNMIVLEDGVRCHPHQFWCDRMGESWNDEWSLFEQ